VTIAFANGNTEKTILKQREFHIIYNAAPEVIEDFAGFIFIPFLHRRVWGFLYLNKAILCP